MVPWLLGLLAAAAILVAGGFVVDGRVERARIGHVQREVAAQGFGAAVSVQPAKGDNCWRASEGFRWKTEGAEGYACAGPRDKVVLYPGAAAQPRP
jgi:hypothetical protein